MGKILFVCMGNSCRSQMAEGFARNFGEGKIEVKSSGILPASALSKKATQVMAEKGIDIKSQYPKPLFPKDIEWADNIIILSPDIQDPQLDLAQHKIDYWNIEDPIGKPIEIYREARNEIEEKVRSLLENL